MVLKSRFINKLYTYISSASAKQQRMVYLQVAVYKVIGFVNHPVFCSVHPCLMAVYYRNRLY